MNNIMYVSLAIIIGVFGLIIFSISCTACRNISGSSQRSAQENAESWAKDLELDVEHVKCNGIDSDGDGYVSCTFKLKDGRIENYECSSSYLYDGCKAIIPKIRRQ